MTHLARVPVRTIIRAIAAAAERWSDADFPARVRILDRICERTGYSIPVVEYALDRLFFAVSESALEATICSELGSLQTLDGFAKRAGRPAAWAVPIGRVCIVSSRTTIGVALVPAFFALCAKCDVVVKDREDALIAAFFDTLSEELDEFAGAACARSWSSAEPGAPALESFAGVVAFGHDDTLADIRRMLRPDARFIGYGSRASAGYVTRESLQAESDVRDIARGAARDLVLYESQGCLSLHVLFLERGGATSPRRFCDALASAVEHTNVEFPVGERDASVAARLSQQRSLGVFRASAGRGAVYANASADYLVLFDPPVEQTPLFLPRALGIVPVDEPDQALEYLQRHRLPLEGFALSAAREDVVAMALQAAAVRFTRFGELQDPPLGADHGGRPRIAEFVRWVDTSL